MLSYVRVTACAVTFDIISAKLSTLICTCQVSCLHLRGLQRYRYRGNKILLTQRNTYIQTSHTVSRLRKYSEPLMCWTTLQEGLAW